MQNIIVAFFLTAVAAGALLTVGETDTLTAMEQVLMIIAGMTTVAALSAFYRFAVGSPVNSVTQPSFNETFVVRTIEESFPDMKEALPSDTRVYPWELTSAQLLGVDNSLALARLRMDLEGELRRVAYESRIDVRNRPLGAVGLAKEMVDKEVLPAPVFSSLKEIVAICNKGIHGESVPDEVAASVIRAGSQLVERLRWSSGNHK